MILQKEKKNLPNSGCNLRVSPFPYISIVQKPRNIQCEVSPASLEPLNEGLRSVESFDGGDACGIDVCDNLSGAVLYEGSSYCKSSSHEENDALLNIEVEQKSSVEGYSDINISSGVITSTPIVTGGLGHKTKMPNLQFWAQDSLSSSKIFDINQANSLFKMKFRKYVHI